MLFLYLDESGNYTYSKSGSEYLVYTSLVTTNPYSLYDKLCNLEKDLKSRGITLVDGCFHASEDLQPVRDEVYKVLREADGYEIDAVYVEKCKANPAVRDLTAIYKKVYGILLRYVLNRYKGVTKIIVFIDQAPNQKKKDALLKGIKETLSDILKTTHPNSKYHVIHIPRVFSYGLQAADYTCWALYKVLGDWGQYKDKRHWVEISSHIRSNFDLFERGDGHKYY
ncbi:MAG: DUF3800 domain-containing protein [Candidatus Omnitrophica bacterium]|nr:DUF3800 domain-containing protein [Candidatus Omnitrophota bacterium]